jgi:hypothetical protein
MRVLTSVKCQLSKCLLTFFLLKQKIIAACLFYFSLYNQLDLNPTFFFLIDFVSKLTSLAFLLKHLHLHLNYNNLSRTIIQFKDLKRLYKITKCRLSTSWLCHNRSEHLPRIKIPYHNCFSEELKKIEITFANTLLHQSK